MLQIIDRYLEVDGLVGDVTLYFDDTERVLVALDTELNWFRYKLLKDVEALTAEQKAAVLEYNLGVGYPTDADVCVADIFKHGEFVEYESRNVVRYCS